MLADRFTFPSYSAEWFFEAALFTHSGGTAPDLHRSSPLCPRGHPRHRESYHQLSTYANSNGATIVASDSITNFGVSIASFSHVIFSFGDAPEYDP